MVDKNLIMQMAGKFLRSEKLENLSKAYDKAQEIFRSSSNAKEAFAKADVSPEMFTKIKSYLNNPMAPFFLRAFGLNQSETKQILDSLSGSNSSSNTSSGGELDSLQNTLRSLQNK